MKLPKIKDIKDFSLLVISNHADIQTKSYSLKIGKIIAYLSLFSVSVIFLTVLFIWLTPAKYMFVSNEAAMKSQNAEIARLNKKLYFISTELEQISSLNKKLKYAIMLGDPTLGKSLNNTQDNAKQQQNSSQKQQGNIQTQNNPKLQDNTKKQNVNQNQSVNKPQNVNRQQNNSQKPDNSTQKKRPGNAYKGYIFDAVKRLFFEGFGDLSRDVFFVFPVESRFISRDFSATKGHMGLDFPVKTGLPVFASSTGIVVFSDYTANDGNMIILMHKNNYITVYKHCSVLLKKLRDKVTQGETIALSGNTGLNTSGPHLHFEIWQNGQAIDPKPFLTQ
ncbi:MAG: M23 family metallopeptidase [Bacteroidota bacterium]|nr:M23 family metallopeptidase [Bacteroidota bacterium]